MTTQKYGHGLLEKAWCLVYFREEFLADFTLVQMRPWPAAKADRRKFENKTLYTWNFNVNLR
jgi:hypothetical protein